MRSESEEGAYSFMIVRWESRGRWNTRLTPVKMMNLRYRASSSSNSANPRATLSQGGHCIVSAYATRLIQILYINLRTAWPELCYNLCWRCTKSRSSTLYLDRLASAIAMTYGSVTEWQHAGRQATNPIPSRQRWWECLRACTTGILTDSGELITDLSHWQDFSFCQ